MSIEINSKDDSWFEDPPEGRAQRQRAIRLIAICAWAISSLYVVFYLNLGLRPLAFFNGVFAGLYALVVMINKPSTRRILGVGLMLLGVLQLVGTGLLFLPPSMGTHLFLMVIPIFSLIVIHPKDQFWWIFFTTIVLVFIGWFEWQRDLWGSLFGGHLVDHDLSVYRGLSAIFTVALSFSVVWDFHRDLNMARKELYKAYDRSETLLRNMLPLSIARRLKKKQHTIADAFEDASVLFADLVGFTALAATRPASETVTMLNNIFSAFDKEVAKRGLEKIKTIGDAYMVAGGLPIPKSDHARQLLGLANDMLEILRRHNEEYGHDLHLRIGMSTGPLIAGVIGNQKLSYDIWGDTVNVASRMESTGIPGRIQVTEGVVKAVTDDFQFEERGMVDVKGRGEMRTYLVVEETRNAPKNKADMEVFNKEVFL
ncbi:MAG: adenylate/guanylate cyclase domain-containing protein [Bdellovibrionota bacterium]|nr:adenylate/guanylate cyclase domain-containing protein [Bdellovibrionota bacterium]